MKSTRRPLVLAAAGGALALVGAVALVAEGLGAASGPGSFPVLAHDGMAPGTVPGLAFLLGLAIVGVGAGVHDSRERSASIVLARTRQSARPGGRTNSTADRAAARPAPAQRPALRVVARATQAPLPRPVHVITSLPPRPAAQGRAHARRTASGSKIELVGTSRKG